MIVKLQKPLASSTPNPPVLAYDQYRTVSVQLPMTHDLDTMFGDKWKIYCAAHIAENGKLCIDRVVTDRAW